MPFLTEKLSPEQYRRSLAALFEITAPGGGGHLPRVPRRGAAAIQPGSSVRAVLSLRRGNPRKNRLNRTLLASGLGRKEIDIVLLQHSSGTTGLQKGVALSHQAVFNQLRELCAGLEA